VTQALDQSTALLNVAGGSPAAPEEHAWAVQRIPGLLTAETGGPPGACVISVRVPVMRMVAVVLGGGTGQRIGAALPKQLLRLGGRTLLEHCVAAFEQAPGVDEILVVMAGDYVVQVRAMLADGGYRKVTGVIPGGVARPDSTRVALAAIAAVAGDPAGCGVLLHDAARPLVDQRIIADCVAALGVHEAAGVAVPASDTMVIADDGVMRSMPRRETLWRCQTPQCFRLPVIARAHELAAADPDFAPTDDCGVVLRYLPGVDVHIVRGSERNLKITYPQDLAVAQALLAEGQPATQ
jgi:2-C-methyl-D-erythritol 4-phosphate cytidylyltransferase